MIHRSLPSAAALAFSLWATGAWAQEASSETEKQPNEGEESAEKTKKPKTAPLPDDPRIQELAAFPFVLYDDVRLGSEPTSADQIGLTDLPPDEYVPEVFQYLRPGLQVKESELKGGDHRHHALTEFRVVDRVVEPGDTVRLVARVSPPFQKGRPFVAEFWSQEYGRAAVVYVNFKPSKKDKTLYLGKGSVGKFHPGGRYNVGSTMVPDEHGHKKAYSHDFAPTMREPDGTPVYFVVRDNPKADLTPPTLVSIRVAEKRVKIGQTIHVEIEAKDEISGPTQAQAVFVSPSGDKGIRADLIGSVREPGKFYGAFSIPEWYEGGAWTIQKLIIYDAARNSGLLFTPTEPLMQGVSFEVEQDLSQVDREPPRLITLEIPKRQAAASESVPVAALVEDNKSGVEKVYVSFLSEHGADLIRVELRSSNPPLNRPSRVPQPNVYRGALSLEKWHERGEYRVTRVNLADRASNYLNLNPVRDEMIQGITVTFEQEQESKGATR
jgi:hypothetical protein